MMGKEKHTNEDLFNQFCDVHTLALYLNMTPRRVQQLVRRGVIEKGDKRGVYELIPCLHNYQNHLKRLVSRYALFYAHKGGREELKQKDRIERRIYRTAAAELKAASVSPPDKEMILEPSLFQFTEGTTGEKDIKSEDAARFPNWL